MIHGTKQQSNIQTGKISIFEVLQLNTYCIHEDIVPSPSW